LKTTNLFVCLTSGFSVGLSDTAGDGVFSPFTLPVGGACVDAFAFKNIKKFNEFF